MCVSEGKKCCFFRKYYVHSKKMMPNGGKLLSSYCFMIGVVRALSSIKMEGFLWKKVNGFLQKRALIDNWLGLK